MPADSVEAGIPEDNHGRNGVTTGTVANKQELKNGGVNCPSDISGLKRKFQDEDSCTLLTKDAHSQAKLEDFKEVLSKEASSGLRSCGWTEEVHRWMWSRKKVCSREASDMATNGSELNYRALGTCVVELLTF
ncbi:ubiquitin carboxyl-terminal hydrolase 25-like isoform X1 [Camellia sinensis]|uniref:ubiquitin carboxyl-terminal hydrolase 25-like isoform X1 n=1 Tax=Camellia sinensis TaxID=4442 RepID=UPI0010355EAE|nr:ubiquitin carboxyl-terminal hydrolase 25-like isoform X1 [Camellia sinensis]